MPHLASLDDSPSILDRDAPEVVLHDAFRHRKFATLRFEASFLRWVRTRIGSAPDTVGKNIGMQFHKNQEQKLRHISPPFSC